MKWNLEEVEILKRNYKTMSSDDLGKMINRTSVAVQLKAKKLGLKKNNLSKTNEDYFESIDSQNKAYWLGFIYADGFVIYNKYKRNYEVGIELNSVDIEHLKKFNSIFNNEHIVSERMKTNNMCRIRIYSKKMCECLIKHNVKPLKTHSKDYPIVDDDLFYHFLRGCIDGDGSYSTYKVKTTKRVIEYPRITIVGNNREFLVYISNKLKNDNIKCGVYSDGNCWKLSTYGKSSYFNLVDKLFHDSDICLERKLDKIQKIRMIADYKECK